MVTDLSAFFVSIKFQSTHIFFLSTGLRPRFKPEILTLKTQYYDTAL